MWFYFARALALLVDGDTHFTASKTIRLHSWFAEFKKIPDDEKVNSFKGLLKGGSRIPSHALPVLIHTSSPCLASHSYSSLISWFFLAPQLTSKRLMPSRNVRRWRSRRFSTCTRFLRRLQIHTHCWRLLWCVALASSWARHFYVYFFVKEQAIASAENTSLNVEVATLKADVSRLRSENADLRRDNNTLETAKRRVEVLEAKVRCTVPIP